MANTTVAAAYVRALFDTLRELGHDPITLLGPEVSRIESAEPGQRVDLHAFAELFARAHQACNRPDLALRVGQGIQARHYGILGYITMSCGTLGEAIRELERYERLVGEISHSSLRIEADTAILRWQAPAGSPNSDLLAQSSLAGWGTYARWLLNQPELICDADFEFPAPDNIQPFLDMVGGRVRFDQSETALRFPIDLLRAPISHADPALKQLMAHQASAQLQSITGESQWLNAFRQQLLDQMRQGTPTLDSACSALALSPRTVQRRLQEQGSNFQLLLDEVRLSRAKQLLADPNLSLVDVAFLLGYSEQSAFTRAFKRWTGQSPRRWRKSLGD